MALASFGEASFSLFERCFEIAETLLPGSAASQYLQREQAKSPNGLREASVKWHFLAFYISGTFMRVQVSS